MHQDDGMVRVSHFFGALEHMDDMVQRRGCVARYVPKLEQPRHNTEKDTANSIGSFERRPPFRMGSFHAGSHERGLRSSDLTVTVPLFHKSLICTLDRSGKQVLERSSLCKAVAERLGA